MEGCTALDMHPLGTLLVSIANMTAISIAWQSIYNIVLVYIVLGTCALAMRRKGYGTRLVLL